MPTRDPDAFFGGLHSDVWRSVLKHLAHHELPKPLSGYTKESSWKEAGNVLARLPSEGEAGTTSRSDIRAHDLATLMRVNINFNLVAAPLLYKRSIVDSLSDLTFNLNTPSANPLTASGAAEIFRSHEESEVLGHPRFSALGTCCLQAMPDRSGSNLFRRYPTLHPPSPPLKPRTPAFPILLRLSISAIYGHQSRRYDYAKAYGYIDQQAMESNCQLISDVFSLSPLLYICSRNRLGPLSVRSILDWSQVPKPVQPSAPVTFCFHSRVDDEFIPAAVGAKTRWILEQHQRINPNTAQKIVRMTGEAIIAAIDQRNSPDHAVISIPDKSLQLEIYSSSKIETRTLRVRGRTTESFVAYVDEDGELEREKIQAVCEAFHKQELEGNGGWPEKEGDNVRWYAGIDAPQCDACGGVFDPDPRSRWGEMSGADLGASFTEHNGVRVD